MNSLAIALAAFVLMLLGAAAAVQLRRRLPDTHFNDSAKDIVRLGAGLMATIAALVLSLLISTANNDYQMQRQQLREIVADIVLVDKLLAEYGPETRAIRERQREAVKAFADAIFRDDRQGPAEAGFMPNEMAHKLHKAIRALAPTDDHQRELRAAALELAISTARARYVLYEGSESALPTPFLVILIGWLATLFMSFCLFSPANRTAIVALVILALSTASALFLLVELSTPFGGLISLSDQSLRTALPPLPPG
ncbi:MAG: hypothetical protein U1E23_00355 [Reyranellaceae bacterium]